MNLRAWMLSPVVVILTAWVMAASSSRAGDMLAENGLLSPSSSDPWVVLPATEGMGLNPFNAVIIAGISIGLSALIWAGPEMSYLWNEPTSVDMDTYSAPPPSPSAGGPSAGDPGAPDPGTEASPPPAGTSDGGKPWPKTEIAPPRRGATGS